MLPTSHTQINEANPLLRLNTVVFVCALTSYIKLAGSFSCRCHIPLVSHLTHHFYMLQPTAKTTQYSTSLPCAFFIMPNNKKKTKSSTTTAKPSPSDKRIPVTVLTGFLGAGKTVSKLYLRDGCPSFACFSAPKRLPLPCLPNAYEVRSYIHIHIHL